MTRWQRTFHTMTNLSNSVLLSCVHSKLTSIRTLKTQLTAADINPRKTDFWFPECQNDPAEDKTWYDRPNNSSTQSSTGLISCENRKYPITIANKSLTEAQEVFPRSRTRSLAHVRTGVAAAARPLYLADVIINTCFSTRLRGALQLFAQPCALQTTIHNIYLFIYLCMYTHTIFLRSQFFL